MSIVKSLATCCHLGRFGARGQALSGVLAAKGAARGFAGTTAHYPFQNWAQNREEHERFCRDNGGAEWGTCPEYRPICWDIPVDSLFLATRDPQNMCAGLSYWTAD